MGTMSCGVTAPGTHPPPASFLKRHPGSHTGCQITLLSFPQQNQSQCGVHGNQPCLESWVIPATAFPVDASLHLPQESLASREGEAQGLKPGLCVACTWGRSWHVSAGLPDPPRPLEPTSSCAQLLSVTLNKKQPRVGCVPGWGQPCL